MSNSKQLPKILHQSATHHLASALSPHTAARSQSVLPGIKVLLAPFKSLKNFYVDFTHSATKCYAKHWGLKRESWAADCRKLRKVNSPCCPLTTQILCSVFEDHKLLNDPISASLSRYTRARQRETWKLAKNRYPIYRQRYKHLQWYLG